MAQNTTNVEVRTNNLGRNIYVVNGYIYVIVGTGRTAGAQLSKFDEATPVELSAAIGPDSDCELAKTFGEIYKEQNSNDNNTELKNVLKAWSTVEPTDADTINFNDRTDDKIEIVTGDMNAEFNPANYAVDNSGFDKIIKFLIGIDSEEFVALIDWAKEHGNKFPKVIDEIADIKNADDIYCTVLIELSRYLGEEIESRTFSIIQSDRTRAEKAEFITQLKNIHALEMAESAKAELVKAVAKMLSF